MAVRSGGSIADIMGLEVNRITPYWLNPCYGFGLSHKSMEPLARKAQLLRTQVIRKHFSGTADFFWLFPLFLPSELLVLRTALDAKQRVKVPCENQSSNKLKE